MLHKKPEHKAPESKPEPVAAPVPERWAVTRLAPGCPQCGTALPAYIPDDGPSWYADCEAHATRCQACDLTVRAYFSVQQAPPA